MAFEQKDNTGSAFKNQRKQSASHADYNGTAKIDGQEYWLNTWVKTTKTGDTYFSHTFKRKEAVRSENKPVQKEVWSNRDDDYDSEIPF